MVYATAQTELCSVRSRIGRRYSLDWQPAASNTFPLAGAPRSRKLLRSSSPGPKGIIELLVTLCRPMLQPTPGLLRGGEIHAILAWFRGMVL